MSATPDSRRLEEYGDDELEEERDFLLRSLADLDAERAAGDVDDHDYAVLRDGYTARAAAVLRALDRRRVEGELAARGATPDPPPGVRRVGSDARPGRSRWKTPAIVGSIAAFAVAAGFGVAGAAGQRLPGDSSSGSVPNNKVQQLLALAVQDFQKGDVVNSVKAYDQALAIAPANAEALTYKGWLLALAGAQGKNAALIDQGLSSIQQAERVAPAYADPHFFAGEIYLRDRGDPTDAITEFESYQADHPPADMGPEVAGELAAAQAALNGVPLPGETISQAPSGAGATPSTTTPAGSPTAPAP